MNFLDFGNMSRRSYLVHLAFFTALAVTVFILESFIPKPMPFMKLGLANIIILMLLGSGNIKPGIIVAFTKSILGGLLAGTLFSPATLLSLSGTFFSLFLMIMLLKIPVNFSILGISIAGAVGHNFGQMIIVRLVLIKENSIFYLTPVLIIMGIATGIITGYLAKIFIDKLKEDFDEKHKVNTGSYE
ncbi:MAG: Gx transporter family protein [Candidatus Cloacimonetes bacterium]|nr:Gx transporter family protein [Candidatus Cloacimonadota bacterium]MCF7812940.1 Gx transporter family protein [Candidatus Cloacimonadota bacterium]MCF7867152.1 Gx transporter family protein [Candidatus Cloacimonadota bacterium]MCF7882528.1 Gx transporter family protein [Candidatus Cloacimonadota bacterium]